MSKQTKAFSADVTVTDGERAVVARITTSAIDREAEVLIPQGMNSKEFEKNPVVFLAHAYYSLPIGKVTDIKRDDKGVVAKVVFAERPENHPSGSEWTPDTLFSLFQQGVLKGFSVGFTVKESRPATDRDVENFGAGVRRVISKWNLLELSVAPLPCNPEAVALAVSKGTLSPAVAKDVFGVEAKEAEPDSINATFTDVTVVPVKRIVAEVEAKEVETVERKRLVYFLPPQTAPTIDLAAIAAKEARAAMQKARGRIYLID